MLFKPAMRHVALLLAVVGAGFAPVTGAAEAEPLLTQGFSTVTESKTKAVKRLRGLR